MRTRTMANAASLIERAPMDGVAKRIEGALWVWIDGSGLLVRLRSDSIPEALIAPSDEGDAQFLCEATKDAARHAMPVTRGDSVTIGQMPVDGKLLDWIEELHGPVTWYPWADWLVGRAASGDVVAVWKIPEGYGAIEMIVLECEEAFWGCTKHFCIRLGFSMDPNQSAKLREAAWNNPDAVNHLAKLIRASAQGRVVSVSLDETRTRIGSTVVPEDQIRHVEATWGKDLEWRWTGPFDPVVAYKHGKAVALIQPVVPQSAGGSS